MSRQSRLSANVKGDNEMMQGDVLRSPGMCLMAAENTGKPQLGDSMVKAVRPVIASNGGSFTFK